MDWLLLAPKIIALVAALINYAIAARERGLGRAEAAAEALSVGAAQVTAAQQARAQAASEQAAHPADDGGFDRDFQRKE